MAALGLASEALVGRSIFAVSRSSDIPDYVRRALAGEHIAAEVVVAERRFAAHYAPLRDHAGSIVGVAGAALDVTAQRAAEAAMRRVEAGLTERECAVLSLLADTSLSYRDIGVDLHIGRSTVRTHLNNLAHKLGVDENRTAVLAAAHERGLLDG